MLSKNFTFLIAFLVSGIFQGAFPQSDYEIVQRFKAKLQDIETQIKDATSLDELKMVAGNIEQLRQDFAEHKDLLDKGLYPENYDKTFKKLQAAYLSSQESFATIDVLQKEVVELVQEVKVLTEKNNEINVMIEKLEILRKNDMETLSEMENLISELRNSLQARDKLVLDMMDKLVPPIMREKATLSKRDVKIIRRLEKKDDVLANVMISIEDNIRFLEATSLNPGDIKEVRSQQDQFATMWEVIGPKLVYVYKENNSDAAKLKEIDSLFNEWYYNSVNKNVWASIDSEFKANGINLIPFSNAKEFVKSVKLFVDDEIKNLGVKSNESSEKTFRNFTDSTWFKVIKPAWMPYLIEGNLLSADQKDRIEASIQIWKEELYPSQWWLYVIIWVLVTVILIPLLLFFIKKRKRGAATKIKV
jgi:hypothetical protein